MDVFSKRKRSEVMSRIRSKDTEPELLVRRELHKRGFRFRIHVASLPGKPDLVLRRHATVIQVKGCFWHGHSCLGGRVPSGNYWKDKISRNRARDIRCERQLVALGWRVLTIWECRIRRRSRGDLDRFFEATLARHFGRGLPVPRGLARSC